MEELELELVEVSGEELCGYELGGGVVDGEVVLEGGVDCANATDAAPIANSATRPDVALRFISLSVTGNQDTRAKVHRGAGR